MIKRQRVILSAVACLCLLLGLGIGLNGCGQKGDLSEKEENSVESQMGEVQQGVEQNTDNAKQFHGNSGNSETGERARTSEQVHASDQNLQNGGQGRNGQLQTSEWRVHRTWIGSGSVAESGRVTENVRATESGRSGSWLGGWKRQRNVSGKNGAGKIFMRKMGRCCISCSCRGRICREGGGVLQVIVFSRTGKMKAAHLGSGWGFHPTSRVGNLSGEQRQRMDGQLDRALSRQSGVHERAVCERFAGF